MKGTYCRNAILLAVAILFSHGAFGRSVTYQVGSYKFDVPARHVPDLSPLGWLRSVAGLDEDVESFVFEFSGEAVASSVEGYMPDIGVLDQIVSGAIYRINPSDKERLIDSEEFSDLWKAQNGYENREVVFDESSGYYFVYESKGYRGMFYIFSKSPESVLPQSRDEFLVATCSGSSLTELQHVSCSRQFLFKPDLVIDFSVSLENLKTQPLVMSFLEKRFSEWLQ